MSGRFAVPAIAGLCVTALAIAVPAAPAADRCVGGGSDCYATIQAALDVSRDGDSISLRPGTYAGGISITKSIRLTGAGAGSTAIRGGGPVVTIGTFLAPTEPTVSISGVTITGGRTHSSPTSDLWPGGPVVARGGGMFVPPAAGLTAGATVSIHDSVISDNRVAPTATIGPDPDQLPFWPRCPSDPCPFAAAEGGGIHTWGALTLTDTLVTDNEAAGPVTSDADGAGIWSALGNLRVVRSAVLRNRAVAVAPNGRYAEGGGIFANNGGSVTIRDSSISDNLVSLANTLPVFGDTGLIEQQSHSGGIHIGDGVPTVVDGARITGNTARASDPRGEPNAFDSAMLVNDSPLTMSDTTIARNRTVSIGATTAHVGPAGSALEVDGGGTIENTSIIDNPSSDTAHDAGVVGALAVYNFSDHPPKQLTVRRSIIAANSSQASSHTGTATAQGGGIVNNSLLTLDHTLVSANTLTATGPAGATEEGGGIWNGVLLTGPPVELQLRDSNVTGNILRPGPNVTAHGGGIFTTFPVNLLRTIVTGNRPDQCFGCPSATAVSALDTTRPMASLPGHSLSRRTP